MLKLRAVIALLVLLAAPMTLVASQSEAAALYMEAKSLIASARYAESLAVLRRLQARHPDFSDISAVQTRIAVLHEHHDAATSLPLFMQALDQRDNHQAAAAVATLVGLQQYPDSPLADDALYIKAYIELMDLYHFDNARASLAQLLQQFPDTSYADSAAYLDAIALEQQGHTDQARLALRILRENHTAVSLPFGFRWPVGNVMSRYWFERADRRLTILQQHSETATRLRTRQQAKNGAVLLDVESGGQRYSLTLRPSAVVIDTDWTNGMLDDQAPPPLAVYSGVVTGEPNSWARVLVNGQSVTGMISIDGQRHKLHADQVLGTMNYYKSGTRFAAAADDPNARDYLAAPARGPAFQTRASTEQSSTRLVSLSVVVDDDFNNFYGGQGVAQALNNINMADGIYREQGVALAIDKVQTLGADNAEVVADSTGTLESLLNSFRQYRLQQRTLYRDSQLVYLFTGVNTSDRTLGLAWIDTLCRTDGYDVGVTTPSNYADVLTAHELGHSFGSLHDSETSCAGDSRKIMWPRISANTTAAFSSCSKQKVSQARASQCLQNAIDLQLLASLDNQTLTINIKNADSLMPATARVLVEAVGSSVEWPSACSEQTPGSAECVVADIAAGETRSLSMLTTNEMNGLITAQATIQGIHDFEPVNNAISVELNTGLITQSLPFSEPTSEPAPAPKPSASGGSGGINVFVVLALALLRIARKTARTARD